MGRFETIVDASVNEGRPYEAYVPSRLQDITLQLSSGVAAKIDRASRLVAQIDARLGASPALPALETLVKSEAIASSYIEGHRISVTELARQGNDFRAASDDVRAVMGNIEATHRAVSVLADPGRPMSIEDVVRIQADLMQTHPNGRHRSPFVGLRSTQAILIPPGAVRGESALVEDATHIPPPASLVGGVMADLLEYINSAPTQSPPLVRAALAHAQFETIHPFPDGNGRTGRALIQAMLRRDGVTKHVVLPLSPYLAMNPQAYVDGLNSVRFDGEEPRQEDIEQWLSVFADCTYSAARNASEVADAIEEVGQGWAEHLRDARVRTGAAAYTAIPHLLGSVATTARDLAVAVGVSEATARTALGHLERAGALSASKGPSGSVVFVADDVADVISRSQRDIAVTQAPERHDSIVTRSGVALPMPSALNAQQRARAGKKCNAWMPRSRQHCNLGEGHKGWPHTGHRHLRK